MLILHSLKLKHLLRNTFTINVRINTVAGLALIAATAHDMVHAHASAQERIARLHAAINFDELHKRHLGTLDAALKQQKEALAHDAKMLHTLETDIAPTLKKQWDERWQKSCNLLEKAWNEAIDQHESNESYFAADQQSYAKDHKRSLEAFEQDAVNLYHSIKADVKGMFPPRDLSWLEDDAPTLTLGTSCAEMIENITAVINSTKALCDRAVQEKAAQHMPEHVYGVHVASLKSHASHANVLEAQLKESIQTHASHQSVRAACYNELKQKIDANIEAFIKGFHELLDEWIKEAPDAIAGLTSQEDEPTSTVSPSEKAHQYCTQKNSLASTNQKNKCAEKSIFSRLTTSNRLCMLVTCVGAGYFAYHYYASPENDTQEASAGTSTQ